MAGMAEDGGLNPKTDYLSDSVFWSSAFLSAFLPSCFFSPSAFFSDFSALSLFLPEPGTILAISSSESLPSLSVSKRARSPVGLAAKSFCTAAASSAESLPSLSRSYLAMVLAFGPSVLAARARGARTSEASARLAGIRRRFFIGAGVDGLARGTVAVINSIRTDYWDSCQPGMDKKNPGFWRGLGEI